MDIKLTISTPDSRHRPTAYMREAVNQIMNDELWRHFRQGQTGKTFHLTGDSFEGVTFQVQVGDD